MSAVQPAYGPTLPEVLGPRRWRVLRAVLVGLAALAVVALAVARLVAEEERVVVGRGAVPFNFAYDGSLTLTGPARVEQRRGGTFVQSMEVTGLALPAYRGDVGGTLPVVADRLVDRLAAEHAGFRLVAEGRTRVNESPGYVVTWEARPSGRRLFGRDYLLTPDEPGVRGGARLALRSTYAGGVKAATEVGSLGPVKRALRSFRFGTERP